MAALITGAFSFLNLIISKEQKISEFRQMWIDELRKDISGVVATVSHISYRLGNQDGLTHAEQLALQAELRETHEAHERCSTNIVLRINPADPDKTLRAANELLLDANRKIADHLNEEKFEEAMKDAADLIEHAQPILKLEWDRVKKGEAVFRRSKNVAAGILIMGLIGALILLVKSIIVQWPTGF